MQIHLIQELLRSCLQVSAVYYGTASLLHFAVPQLFHVKRLHPHGPLLNSEVRRDMLRSLPSLAIKACTLVIAQALHRSGYGMMTDNLSIQEIVLNPFVLGHLCLLWFLMDLFHDTWFYFMHRILHVRWILRNIHYMHHQSSSPSAFTGYSFHWVEAIAVFAVAIVEIFIFPIPASMHTIYELWMIMIHVGGHCGYEMFPYVPHLAMLAWCVSLCSPTAGRWVNDVAHHEVHHRSPGHHFSLYFTHWDRLLATIHPSYWHARLRS